MRRQESVANEDWLRAKPRWRAKKALYAVPVPICNGLLVLCEPCLEG